MDSPERSDADYVQGERAAPHVLLIRFTRSAKRNALSNPMVIELARLLQDAGNDPDIRAVVITGDEQAFSAGADLANMRKGGVTAVVNDPLRVDAWRVIEKFAKPMIAAVNGYAFGAGNELAMCCDFVIAGRNAQFGQPEVKTGGMPGDGGTQRLPRKVGPNLAAYMIMTGNPIDAETAFRVGYAVEVCETKDTVAPRGRDRRNHRQPRALRGTLVQGLHRGRGRRNAGKRTGVRARIDPAQSRLGRPGRRTGGVFGKAAAEIFRQLKCDLDEAPERRDRRLRMGCGLARRVTAWRTFRNCSRSPHAATPTRPSSTRSRSGTASQTRSRTSPTCWRGRISTWW